MNSYILQFSYILRKYCRVCEESAHILQNLREICRYPANISQDQNKNLEHQTIEFFYFFNFHTSRKNFAEFAKNPHIFCKICGKSADIPQTFCKTKTKVWSTRQMNSFILQSSHILREYCRVCEESAHIPRNSRKIRRHLANIHQEKNKSLEHQTIEFVHSSIFIHLAVYSQSLRKIRTYSARFAENPQTSRKHSPREKRKSGALDN